jgi:hypothetical protein
VFVNLCAGVASIVGSMKTSDDLRSQDQAVSNKYVDINA